MSFGWSNRLLLILLSITGVFCADNADTGGKSDDEALERLKQIRQGLNVYTFSSLAYSPIFGIIAGISIVLIVAVTFIIVGLLSMEPAKDSIIYRMTTTRLKKD